MHHKGTASIIAVFLLCLPSLAGAIVLLCNSLLHRPIGEWSLASSVTVALAVLFGGPLVFVAIIVGATALLNVSVPMRIKYADATILGLAMISAVLVAIRFRI